jgi:hypothetical protein
MKFQLENLSVEELKILREDINLLLKNKYEPKYKENTCFINPQNLSFLCIHCAYDDVDIDRYYRIVINNLNGENYMHNVDESFLNKCLVISKEIYNSLLFDRNEIKDKINNLKDKQINEFYNYEKSLNSEFKEKLQKVINELNKS